MDEKNYWLAFSVFSGIGPIKFKKLLAQFGRAKDVWKASKPDLTKVIGEKLAEKLDEFRDKFSISGYSKKLDDSGVSFLILTDKEYPALLSQIKNPPFLLYFKGDSTTLYSSRDPPVGGESRSSVTPDPISSMGQALIVPRLDRGLDARWSLPPSSIGRGNDKFSSRQARTIIPTIAVVGARKTTQYGREVTKILTEQLVEAGFTIVSGLAVGVDGISHKTAIENGGKTIAVLGCGVDCCYPLVNQSIYNSIISGSPRGEAGKGCVVSEYPLGQAPSRGSFPARNRIIAGLSLGVLVTEGAEDSGSLITADYAVKFGRPAFAVPGPITSSMSKGPYKLIAKGAMLVTSAKDILDELKISNPKSQIPNKSSTSAKASADKQNTKFKTETKEEEMILELLQSEPLHFDELVRLTGFESAKTGSILSVMEIKGLVKGLESGQFSIAS